MMSTVKYFFDISQQQLARQLFANSVLAKQHLQFYESNCGQYPVIFVSFAECTASTWLRMKALLISIISDAFGDWRHAMESPEIFDNERELFSKCLRQDEDALYEVALKKLTVFLHRVYKKRVVVVIDEYEKPLNVAFENGFLDEAVAFLSGALTGCLKNNPYAVFHFTIPHTSLVHY